MAGSYGQHHYSLTLLYRHCLLFQGDNLPRTKQEMDTEMMVMNLGELQRPHGI